MRTIAKQYFDSLDDLLGRIQATDAQGGTLQLTAAMELAAQEVERRRGTGKLIFIGNGASAAISSHMSTDYWKNGRIRAVPFSDPALLTCMGNDYGYQHIFEKPVEMFADPGDLLMAISSSGRSENILLAAKAAHAAGAEVMTFSGFSPDNPLRALGKINFFVPCDKYGPVEVLHHAICHGILDTLIEARRRGESHNG